MIMIGYACIVSPLLLVLFPPQGECSLSYAEFGFCNCEQTALIEKYWGKNGYPENAYEIMEAAHWVVVRSNYKYEKDQYSCMYLDVKDYTMKWSLCTTSGIIRTNVYKMKCLTEYVFEAYPTEIVDEKYNYKMWIICVGDVLAVYVCGPTEGCSSEIVGNILVNMDKLPDDDVWCKVEELQKWYAEYLEIELLTYEEECCPKKEEDWECFWKDLSKKWFNFKDWFDFDKGKDSFDKTWFKDKWSW